MIGLYCTYHAPPSSSILLLLSAWFGVSNKKKPYGWMAMAGEGWSMQHGALSTYLTQVGTYPVLSRHWGLSGPALACPHDESRFHESTTHARPAQGCCWSVSTGFRPTLQLRPPVTSRWQWVTWPIP